MYGECGCLLEFCNGVLQQHWCDFITQQNVRGGSLYRIEWDLENDRVFLNIATWREMVFVVDAKALRLKTWGVRMFTTVLYRCVITILV